jgi:hypothetical protein
MDDMRATEDWVEDESLTLAEVIARVERMGLVEVTGPIPAEGHAVHAPATYVGVQTYAAPETVPGGPVQVPLAV